MTEEAVVPLKIESIEFENIYRTDHAFLYTIFKPLLGVGDVSELKTVLAEAMQKVNRLQLFKNSSISLSEGSRSKEGLKLTFRGEEKRYRIKAGTEVQKQDLAFSFGGFWANVFGRGETLEANASYGMSTATPLMLSFKKPMLFDPDRILDFSFINTVTGRTSWQPFKSQLHQMAVSYSFPSLLGLHNIKSAVEQRSLFDFLELSSPSMKGQEGTFLKSSIAHSVTLDRRDDRIIPSKGFVVKQSTEIAGLFGGVTNYLKNDLQAQLLVPLFKRLSVGASVHHGFMIPILQESKVLSMDRFHMGGSHSLRGFQTNSLGPRDKEDSLGGRYIAEGALQLSFPFSDATSKVVRGHLFVNSGLLSEESLFEASIGNNLHSSVGCGLIANLGGARFEFNACYPIRHPHAPSLPRPSIQIGIGMDFL